MKQLREFFISLALSILSIVGLMGIILWGMILSDKISGRDNNSKYFVSYAGSTATGKDYIFSRVQSLVETEQYDKLQSFGESMGFSFYLSDENGSPISHYYINDAVDLYGDLKQTETLNIVKDDGERVILRVRLIEKKDNGNGFLTLLGSLWIIVASNKLLLFGGLIVWLAVFVLSVFFTVLISSPIYKLWLLVIIFTGVDALFIKRCGVQSNTLLIGCMIEKAALGGALSFYIINVKKLRNGIKQISEKNGDRIELKPSSFPISLKPFAMDINMVSERVREATDEKIKSERFKTELISNVSHDIKTPLTSIINFSDLISREKTENPVITEYAEHLHIQSVRLKDLLEALIEASRASTGAIDISLEPCKVSTLLKQCVIEYEEKLLKKNIAVVIEEPEENLYINADVKAISRIMDNIMTNISKYAMPGSRAYIKAGVSEDNIVIAFKNITEEPVNISEDELTERFVRGDVSRHSDGYGLGLSIIKSLMDLMGAKVDISAQFDVFEVRLIFDLPDSSQVQ